MGFAVEKNMAGKTMNIIETPKASNMVIHINDI